MASEIAMLTTLEMQNVNFRQYYFVLRLFKKSMLTVVLVDGIVVVDEDGVVVDEDGVVVDEDGVVVDEDGV